MRHYRFIKICLCIEWPAGRRTRHTYIHLVIYCIYEYNNIIYIFFFSFRCRFKSILFIYLVPFLSLSHSFYPTRALRGVWIVLRIVCPSINKTMKSWQEILYWNLLLTQRDIHSTTSINRKVLWTQFYPNGTYRWICARPFCLLSHAHTLQFCPPKYTKREIKKKKMQLEIKCNVL